MKLLFATSNPHKLRELRQMLSPLGITVEGLDALSSVPPEPVEDGETFEANARIKAVGYATATAMTCLAEDSGLEVDALDGAPGVRSARYAEHDGDRDARDRANNDKLLAALRDVPKADRTARFVCAMCVSSPEGAVRFEARGTFEGVVAEAPAGEGGFGYDPLLYVPDAGCTSAQLAPEEKNRRSHRGAAARALVQWLREQGSTA